jgi:glutamate N-acetyltransferase/amino-acid N-acetyltransferase
MKLPQGFQCAAGTAGIKQSGKPDVALIAVETAAAWALTATTNRVKAACVTRNLEQLQSSHPIRAIIINSGNANCATGEAGARTNLQLAALAAQRLGVRNEEVITASTGVIGHQLPLAGIESTLPTLSLADDCDAAAEAILTTDLVTKAAGVNLPNGASIVGFAKGSGMIHPNMATMLAFVMTDAAIDQDRLRELWREIVNQSFNQITVDGDTSTNDMAVVLSSGQIDADEDALRRGLLAVCQQLAQKIARDGEGANKLITVNVIGAETDTDARRAARAIVRSPLVKSAVHGNDPNWGRILSAIGQEGVDADYNALTITVQGELLFAGKPLEFDAEHVSHKMNHSDLRIDIDLKHGNGQGQAWGCDLSAQYVHINADYHT